MTQDAHLLLLARIVGAPVRDAEPTEPSATAPADLVTLADGRRLVVRRYADRASAARAVRMARLLGPRLDAAGIPVPPLLRGDPDARPPFAISLHVDGRPGTALLDDPLDAIALGTEMGRLVARLRTVRADDLRLPATWSDRQRLATLAGGWLADLRGALEPPLGAVAADAVAALPSVLAGRRAVLAHGAWVPGNVVVRGRAVVAVTGWEDARLADPLFDVAWWGWSVGYQQPSRLAAAWPAFLETAGCDLSPDAVERIRVLTVVHLLELAAAATDERETWLRQLRDALGRSS